MKLLPVVLIAAYPALTHAGVILDAPYLPLAGLILLLSAVLFKPLARLRLWAWLGLAACTAALAALARAEAGRYAIYLPSLLIPGALCILFGGTLRAGAEPLISALARSERGGTLAPDLVGYTRRLTQLWTLMFALMFAGALTLIVLDEIRLWSLLTNVLNYIAVGLLLVLEYVYRRWRFRHHPHPGFFEHLRTVARTRRGVS
ncbi:MAG: hypothetical protein AB1651_10865 [Pseudomonadota bacterium]